MSGSRGASGQGGFSLVELLVVTVVLLGLVAGLGTLLTGVEESHADLMDRMSAQQAARMAMTQIQRDLQVVGMGLARLQPPFPVVVPRDDGFDLRLNRDGVTTFLVKDMPSAVAPLDVDSVAGFEVDDVMAVYDATGSIDLVPVKHVIDNPLRLLHDGLSKAYEVDDGTAVALVRTITYRLVGTDLVREVDGEETATAATSVQGLEITYFDDSSPPVAFDPDTDAERMRIRMIGVSLTVSASRERLMGPGTPSFTLSARVAPRSLVFF